MELGAAGLKEQPFRTHGRPVAFFAYTGQVNAYDFLLETCDQNGGIGLLQGPSLSGKTTIIKQFAEQQRANCAVAIVDCKGLDHHKFLESVLRGFGYEHKFDTVNELLNMLKVFMNQQTASGQPPVLIIENTHEMTPDALGALCGLAEIRVKVTFSLRIVLVSDRTIEYILETPAAAGMSKRLSGDFHIEPLTISETREYLFAKLRYSGCVDPGRIFPNDVCCELYRASGGWPGILDRLALLAIAQADSCPVRPTHVEHPTIPHWTCSDEPASGNGTRKKSASKGAVLCLTHNGKTLEKIPFSGARLLIGRSDQNDLSIDSAFVSRHHAMLVRQGSAIVLVDLNSANGSFVNSWRVSSQVLAHNDIITLGEHGIKFIDESARVRPTLKDVELSETTVMRTVADMRRMLARENTKILPAEKDASESSSDTA